MYHPKPQEIFNGLEIAYEKINHKVFLDDLTMIPGINKKECIQECIIDNIISLMISGVFSGNKLPKDEFVELIKKTIKVPTKDKLDKIKENFEIFYAKKLENKAIEIVAGFISIEYIKKYNIREYIKDFLLVKDEDFVNEVISFLEKKVI